MPSRRQERISELLGEELGLLISAELLDPGLEDALLSVTDVDVSADLRSARVYVQHSAPPEQSRNILRALGHAETYLRRALLENLNLRYVPHLTFHIDNAEQRGRRVDEILDSLPPTPGETQTDAQQSDQ